MNEYTIKNFYPLLQANTLIESLKEIKMFTILDLQWRYNNLHIKESNKWKISFKTSRELFEWLVAFFRLYGMPAIFQAMINEIFKEELLAGWLKIYLDNIIITSTIHQKDQEQTRYILQKLKNNDLYCNLEKYVFSASKVNYLGLIIEKNQVSMHSTKLEGILK